MAVDNPKHAAPVEAMENIITAHYFSALGVPILTGREELGFAKLGCAAIQAALSSGLMTGSVIVDCGRAWPWSRGDMQS